MERPRHIFGPDDVLKLKHIHQNISKDNDIYSISQSKLATEYNFLLLLIYSIPSVIRRSIPRSCCRISCQSNEIVVAPMVDWRRKSNGLAIGNPTALP